MTLIRSKGSLTIVCFKNSKQYLKRLMYLIEMPKIIEILFNYEQLASYSKTI
jgi:hypothetical protein